MSNVNHRLETQQQNFEKFGEPETLQELAEFLIQVINNYSYLDYNRERKHAKVAGFSMRMHYSDTVGNAHCSPIRGVDNFSRQNDLPTGYAGWVGRVWIRYQNEIRTFGSDPFRTTNTHTGSGGRGSYDGPWEKICDVQRKHQREIFYPEPGVYSWDYRIFLDDWPKLKRNHEKLQTFNALAETRTNQYFSYLWDDPVVAEKDQEYIDSVYEMLSRNKTNDEKGKLIRELYVD